MTNDASSEKLEKFLLYFIAFPILIINNFFLKHSGIGDGLVQSLFNVSVLALIICNITSFSNSLSRFIILLKMVPSKRWDIALTPIFIIHVVYFISLVLILVYIFSFNLIANRLIIYCLIFTYFFGRYFDQRKMSNKFETAYFLIVLCIMAGSYLWSILSYRTWVYGDEQQFLCSILSGTSIPMLMLKSSGRFYPFGFVEYNWIQYVGKYKTDMVFIWLSIKFLFSIGSIVYTSILLIKDDIRLNIRESSLVFFISISVYFCSPDVIKIFSSGIYIESTIILSVVLSIAFYIKAKQQKSIFLYMVSTAFVIFSLYLKETVFLFYMAFLSVNISFWNQLNDRTEKTYFVVILLNIIIFFILYYSIILNEVDTFYNQGRTFDSSRLDLLVKQLKLNPLFVLLYSFALFRAYQIIFRRDRDYLLLDSILAGCVSYAVSFIVLKLCENYMFAPCYAFIAILSFSYMQFYLREKSPVKGLFKFSVLFLLIILSYHTSQYNFSEIKTIINNKNDQLHYTKILLDKLENGYAVEFILRATGKEYHKVQIHNWQAVVINRFVVYFRNGSCKNTELIKKTAQIPPCRNQTVYLIPTEESGYLENACNSLRKSGSFFGLSLYDYENKLGAIDERNTLRF